MKRIILICFLFPVLIPVCRNALNSSCRENKDCEEFNYCNLTKQECVHEDLYPVSNITLFGMFCLFFISAIANAGGIGGGGLVVPILLIVLKFYTYEAIPISKLMIFSGSLTSFFMGFKVKNPLRKGTVAIDYNIPALLCPFLLFGTMVGVTINKIVPPIVVLISLSTVLIINTIKTFKKAISLYKKENLNEHYDDDQGSEELENQQNHIEDIRDPNPPANDPAIKPYRGNLMKYLRDHLISCFL